MIELRRTQVGGDASYERNAKVDLTDGGLDAIDDVAGRLEFAKAAQRGGEVEFDAGEQLTELVVQFARDARSLFLAHLLDAFGQRSQLVGIERRRLI